MLLSALLIRNFRLIQEAALPLLPGIQLFLGMNAQGKTSLVEAVHFLSTSTSHRTNREEELIRWGQDVAFLRGRVEGNGESSLIECGLEKKRKVIRVDGSPLPRVGDLYGRLRTVLFAPEDLNIVSGSPHDRRRFLDMAIAQLEPNYIRLLQNFRKALRQRNHILKRLQSRHDREVERELAVWDVPFRQYAVQVVRERVRNIQELSPLVENFYSDLADEGPFRLAYTGGDTAEEAEILATLAQKMERSRKIEIERGSTQVGPHRDDLILQLQGKNISQFGSQGQRRTAALALRLAEAKHGFQRVGQRSLLLIDDVMHEMDNTRRARFWNLLDPQGQMIVTATDLSHLGPGMEPAQIFEVTQGTFRLRPSEDSGI